MNDQQIRELAKKHSDGRDTCYGRAADEDRIEAAIREAISLTRNEVIEECAKVADYTKSQYGVDYGIAASIRALDNLCEPNARGFCSVCGRDIGNANVVALSCLGKPVAVRS